MTTDADDARASGGSVVRHEEELSVGTQVVDAGSLRVRKRVDVEDVRESVPRDIESLGDVERVGAGAGDSGEIERLPDGSISLPIFEERLVVSKQLVVRERVIVRKTTETVAEEVRAELRRERVDVETEDVVEIDPEEHGEA